MNTAFNNFDEQAVSETESEKGITKTLTQQLSNTNLFNENPVLYKGISHVFSGMIIF